jgi:hypothetical protein
VLAGALRDDLAWFWAIAAVGAILDKDSLTSLGELIVALPGGELAVMTAPANPPRAQAQRTTIALAQRLAATLRERTNRLIESGALDTPGQAAQLRWDELLAGGKDLTAIVARRAAEQERLTAINPPTTLAAAGPGAAIAQPADDRELMPA